MTIVNTEALQARAKSLDANGLNGMQRVLVTLGPPVNPTVAHLEVQFYTPHELANIVTDIGGNLALGKQIFPISGGHRVLAGSALGQVQVVAIAQPTTTTLDLTVAPIGDYSTYTLSLNYRNIDPILNEVPFKFRPGCFSSDCAPEWTPTPNPSDNPTIDYLAKDYDSFRHTMIVAMMQRVPGWRPTSEADLDQVLLEVFSVAADELSDYQDRVMNEAYLATARKRVSLARHARLMDYHIHQGNQASTWLAVTLSTPLSSTTPLVAWSGQKALEDADAIAFVSRTVPQFDILLNQMGLYTWNDAIPSLAAGSTQADLQLTNGTTPITDQASADKVRDFIRDGKVPYLLIQEWLNPATGNTAGRNPAKRQLLKVRSVESVTLQDPLTGAWMIRVYWEEQDKLKFNYCFTVNCPTGKVENVSRFHGNLIEVYHGRSRILRFKEPPLTLAKELYYERTDRWGTLCRLPAEPLAYKDTLPGGEISPRSTLAVEVTVNGVSDPWTEEINLIHSDDSDENGDHFIVETDEFGYSILRFGNGINGKVLPPNAEVRCTYQVGRGLDGNIGRDKLTHTIFPEIETSWNPFDVENGRAPEPVAEVIRRAPEAYRFRQLRAVTLQDYVNRAEELAEVARAAARYAWTGSWRTVQIAIDPSGTTTLDPSVRDKIARYLDAVRLIGEDLEVRPPRFVPLDIRVALCIHPNYWPEDIRFLLEQEFSEGYTPDGRRAFFHPDRWTFGQTLHASQILGRIQAIEGVEHVISVMMKRWNEPTPGTDAIVQVRANEILRVRNAPDSREDGFINFDLRGGRQ
jgi:Baseplate J-like protein